MMYYLHMHKHILANLPFWLHKLYLIYYQKYFLNNYQIKEKNGGIKKEEV